MLTQGRTQVMVKVLAEFLDISKGVYHLTGESMQSQGRESWHGSVASSANRQPFYRTRNQIVLPQVALTSLLSSETKDAYDASANEIVSDEDAHPKDLITFTIPLVRVRRQSDQKLLRFDLRLSNYHRRQNLLDDGTVKGEFTNQIQMRECSTTNPDEKGVILGTLTVLGGDINAILDSSDFRRMSQGESPLGAPSVPNGVADGVAITVGLQDMEEIDEVGEHSDGA